jgi:tetratricopeptide (TPR) repeat protein
MLLAHRDGLLEESSQEQLVNWLHDDRRFAESTPILEPLVTVRPDVIRYRTRLMAAYFHSQRPEQLIELVKQTDTHFHAGGRWAEGNIAEFAKGCLGCNLLELSVGYFNEAIALHQRNNPGHGPGDVSLSDWYQHLAQAHSTLGQTRQAVDAASGAIICWGPRHDQRAASLAKLNQVLSESKDLAAYVQHLDQESAKTGQDSPILRKALGQVYQARKEFRQAIAQFQAAVALQPNDKEVHQSLIACYDATKDNNLATRQLLKLIDFDRHDLALYQQLAERLKDNEAEAERAATSIIEAAPNEAENHAALAELRQKQNRWDEAIPHWEQVAEQRRLEPTGLLKLAEAQLHQKQWDTARRSIEKLQKTEWPARFNDVSNHTRRLQEQLPK